jgi:cytochrome b
MTGTDASSSILVRLWDRPVRSVHWTMVLLVALAWWAVETGHMAWHYRFGDALLGLLLFRLIWGFVGSSTARFASFVRGPRQVLRYLRGDRRHTHGHNPLGALSVIALLGILVLQVGLGLFAASPNGSKAGPFAAWVAPGMAHEAAGLHKANFYLLLALIGLHVGAILFYLLSRRDDLITPMLTGRRRAPAGTRPVQAAPAWRLLIAVAAGAGIAIWLILSGRP